NVDRLTLRQRRGKIFDGVECPIPVLILNLVVGNCRLECCIPVHDALATIYETILIHHFEDFIYTAVEGWIHRVALLAPITARSHLADLTADRATAFLHEFCNSFH